MCKKILVSIVLLIGVIVSAQAQNDRPSVIPNAYIVEVIDRANVEQVANDVARLTGGGIRHVYTEAVSGFAIHVPSGVGAVDILTHPQVLTVEPDLEVSIPERGQQKAPPPGKGGGGGSVQPPQIIPTGIDRIDADLSVTAKINGSDERVAVDIAILDTGIDLDHPDLNVVVGVNFAGGGKNADDKNGHGTHVAGTAAAIDNTIGVVGVAPGARLYAVKVLGNDGSGFLSDVIAGIDWVTANANTIDVVNMSLGGSGKSDTFRKALQNSVAVGVVYVVAAGNRRKDIYGDDGIFNTTDDFIPASYPEVSTISAMADSDGASGGTGSITTTGDGDDTIAAFSNFNVQFGAEVFIISSGGAIDLAGPGVDIRSTWINGGYNTLSGTSMSTPHITGAAGLYIAVKGRDVNGDGIVNGTDVATIRQVLINLGEPQSVWGPINTQDPDANKEALVDAGLL